MAESTGKRNIRRWLRPGNIVFVALFFVFGILALNQLVWFFARTYFNYEPSLFWPMNIMELRVHPIRGEWLFLAAQVVFFLLGLHWISRKGYPPGMVLPFALLLIFGSNLSHSWHEGMEMPHHGENQYIADLPNVGSTGSFLHRYNAFQPHLQSVHSKSHPPGAVLTYYYLEKLSPDLGESLPPTGFISLWILVLSTLGSGFFFYRFWKLRYGDALPGTLSLLYLLVPAVMIYYCASLDALIATYTVAFLYFLQLEDRLRSSAGMVAAGFLFSFSTFGFLFLLPVFALHEWHIRRDWRRFALVMGGLGLIYLALKLGFGYDHLRSFVTASRIENEGGFLLSARPVHYFFSRLQGVMELVYFFSPFLILLMWSGLRRTRDKDRDLWWLCIGAMATMVAMLLTGAFRVAETGRAAMFLYPFLLLPVGAALGQAQLSRKETKLLLSLVYFQGLLWQFIGFYFW